MLSGSQGGACYHDNTAAASKFGAVTFVVTDGEVSFASSFLGEAEEEAVPHQRLVRVRSADGLDSLRRTNRLRRATRAWRVWLVSLATPT